MSTDVQTPAEVTEFAEITVLTNHGFVVLKDATLVRETRANERRWIGEPATHNADRITGTVVYGHSTSRLFSATSTRYEKEGEVKTIEIWGRTPRRNYQGEWEISLQFCG